MASAQLHVQGPGAGSGIPSGLVGLTHIIYALHAFSVVTGIATSATIVGSFLFSLPSILAVILNYVKRSDARGTFLESHFRWQIRTFWFAFLWMSVSFLLAVTIIGIPLALGLIVIAGIWVLYRVIRGWLALNERRTVGTS